MKIQNKETRYFIDINLISKEIINWDYDQRDLLKDETLEIPGLHRIYLSKGQFNKLVEKINKNSNYG